PRNRASDHPTSSRSVSTPRHGLRSRPRLSRIRARIVSLLRRAWCRLKCGPEEAGQLTCDGYGDLRHGLMLFREPPEATTQSLLRLVRNPYHPRRLGLASFRERHAASRAMWIVPRRLHEQPTD